MGERARALGGGLVALLGFGLGVLILALVIGGETYRKDCVTPQGTVKHDWTTQFESVIPYVFRPSQPGCAVHSGTRVVLNEIGVFPYTENPGRIVAKSGGSSAAPNVAYYDAIYTVLSEVAEQIKKSGGLLTAPQDFMRQGRRTLEKQTPPESVASQHAELLKDYAALERELAEARTAAARPDEARLNTLGLQSKRHFENLVHTGEEIRSAVAAERR